MGYPTKKKKPNAMSTNEIIYPNQNPPLENKQEGGQDSRHTKRDGIAAGARHHNERRRRAGTTRGDGEASRRGR